MLKGNTLIICIAAVAFAACSRGLETPREAQAIAVASSIDETATKAAYALTTPNSDNPLAAAVWVSTTAHTFPGTQVGADNELATIIDYHNTATFTSSSRQLLNAQLYYPSTDVPVYLVGMYPSAGWTTSDGTSGLFSFDGSKDVMFAPEVSNHINTSANYPILRFRHLLTWLKINIAAENQETADVWGKLKSISLKSMDQVSILFETGAATFTESETAHVMPLRLVSDDSALTARSLVLPLSSEYMAYVLCAPVIATDSAEEYVLTINTVNRVNVQVPLNLKAADGSDFSGSTAGHQFTISLKFVQGDNILTSAVVSEWQNGGSTLIPVDE